MIKYIFKKSLSGGVYEYKYIVDGIWKCSMFEKKKSDENGNENNYIDTTEMNLTQGSSNISTDKVTSPERFLDGPGKQNHNNKNNCVIMNKLSSPSSASPKDRDFENNMGFSYDQTLREDKFDKDAPEAPSHLLRIDFLQVECFLLLISLD